LMDIRLAGLTDGIATAEVMNSHLGIRSVFVTAHSDHKTCIGGEGANPLRWRSHDARTHEVRSEESHSITCGVRQKRPSGQGQRRRPQTAKEGRRTEPLPHLRTRLSASLLASEPFQNANETDS
jgi:hypothetical protein